MSTAFRVLAVLLVVGLLAGIGISVYNAGDGCMNVTNP